MKRPPTVSELAQLYNGATGPEKAAIQKKLLRAIKIKDENVQQRLERGKELRRMRRSLDITQEQLALVSGVRANYICRIERGVNVAREETLDKLFEALKEMESECGR